MYQHLRDIDGKLIETILRLVDNAYIPHDVGNRDWIEYQSWVAAGGVALAATMPPLPTIINPASFIGRFTATEQTALWNALALLPQSLGQLILYLANGSIDLLDTRTSTFLDPLVKAKVITAARKTAILTP